MGVRPSDYVQSLLFMAIGLWGILSTGGRPLSWILLAIGVVTLGLRLYFGLGRKKDRTGESKGES